MIALDTVATVKYLIGERRDEIQANAKLIAAAPEMLKALEEVTTFLGHVQPRIGKLAFNHIWEEVTEAIKKATE